MRTDQPRGLLIDWGGVLTTSVFAAIAAFCAREGLPRDAVDQQFRTNPGARDLVAAFERGTMPEEEFGERFAALLGVPGAGLIDRMLADLGVDAKMVAVVRRARAHGIPACLISNSWGVHRYDPEVLDLFDGVVISATVGVRKPEPEIYALGLARVGLPAPACVFVDDVAGNLKPARALGMATIHHIGLRSTVADLSAFFGRDLALP